MLIVPRFYHIHRRPGAKIVAASGHLEVKKFVQNLFTLGVWGTYSAPPDTLAGGEGARSPSPRTKHASAVRASAHFPSPGKNPAGAHVEFAGDCNAETE